MERISGIKGTIAAVLDCPTALWGWSDWPVVAWTICMLLDYTIGAVAITRTGK